MKGLGEVLALAIIDLVKPSLVVEVTTGSPTLDLSRELVADLSRDESVKWHSVATVVSREGNGSTNARKRRETRLMVSVPLSSRAAFKGKG